MQSKQASNYLKNKTRTTQITLVVEKEDNISCGVSNLGQQRNELVFHPAPKIGAKSMKTNPIDRKSTFFKIKPCSEEGSNGPSPFQQASSGSSGTAGTIHSDRFHNFSIRQR